MKTLCHVSLTLLVVAAPLWAKEDAFRQDIAQWRQARKASLLREDGWLTLVGLHWLQPGGNAFGSDPSLPVVLEGKGIAAKVGEFVVGDGKVRLRPLPDGGLTLRGAPVREEIQVRVDVEGAPDIFQVGGLAFQVIKRKDRFGVRVKDPQHPARLAFKGVPTYRPDPAFRVVGTFVPSETPRRIQVPTVLGYSETMESPGLVTFKLRGRKFTLEPVIEGGEHPELFFIFRDGTSGHGTYGAGRFLYAPMPKAGRVILDFNKAQNPPCAFTPFATCPLPPKQNWLKVAVKAGEKAVGDH